MPFADLKTCFQYDNLRLFKSLGNLPFIQGHLSFPKVAIGNEIHNQGGSFAFPLVVYLRICQKRTRVINGENHMADEKLIN